MVDEGRTGRCGEDLLCGLRRTEFHQAGKENWAGGGTGMWRSIKEAGRDEDGFCEGERRGVRGELLIF